MQGEQRGPLGDYQRASQYMNERCRIEGLRTIGCGVCQNTSPFGISALLTRSLTATRPPFLDVSSNADFTDLRALTWN